MTPSLTKTIHRAVPLNLQIARPEASSPSRRRSGLAWAGVVLLTCQLLGGCVPLVVGGAVMGGMVAVDRRTSGTQLEDQGIELKSINRVHEATGARGHVSVTSYNRVVLLTGEVANEADRLAAEAAARQVDNVRSVVNELAVMEVTAVGSRSNDLVLTGKIKASFVDAADLHTNALKVVTERAVVHLMGRVTEREAGRATDVARGVSGVKKVVRVFEIISEAELAALTSQGAAKK